MAFEAAEISSWHQSTKSDDDDGCCCWSLRSFTAEFLQPRTELFSSSKKSVNFLKASDLRKEFKSFWERI